MHDEFDVLESSGFTVYDSWLKREITHRGWLLLAVGDAPVVSLYMNAWGHTSIRGCWRCFFCALHATKLGGTGGVFFTGYTGPAEQQLGLFKYSVGDNHTLVSKRCKATAIMAFAAQRTTHDLLVAMSNDAEAEIAAGKSEATKYMLNLGFFASACRFRCSIACSLASLRRFLSLSCRRSRCSPNHG